MMTRAIRRDRTLRAEDRRWRKQSAWMMDRIELNRFGRPTRWSDEPTYRFCLTSMGLTILYWSMRYLCLARQRRWVIESHNCSCPMCRSHTRRFTGNSLSKMTIQEQRLRTGYTVDDFLNDEEDQADADWLEWLNSLGPFLDEITGTLV